MLNDREHILTALREKSLKVDDIMKRAKIANEAVCQSLLKMRDEGLEKFDIYSARWVISAARPTKRVCRRAPASACLVNYSDARGFKVPGLI
jgi:hypothetical protein